MFINILIFKKVSFQGLFLFLYFLFFQTYRIMSSNKKFFGIIELSQYQKDLLQGIKDLLNEDPNKYFNATNESRWRYIRGGKDATRRNSIYLGRVKPFGKPHATTQLSKVSREGLFLDLESLIIAFNDTIGINSEYYLYDKDLDINVAITNLINRNLGFNKHKDKNNKLMYSYITGFGDYTGGELIVEIPKLIYEYYDFQGCDYMGVEGDNVIIKVNIRDKLFRLPLRDCNHMVEDWQGDRYSLVIYSIQD